MKSKGKKRKKPLHSTVVYPFVDSICFISVVLIALIANLIRLYAQLTPYQFCLIKIKFAIAALFSFKHYQFQRCIMRKEFHDGWEEVPQRMTRSQGEKGDKDVWLIGKLGRVRRKELLAHWNFFKSSGMLFISSNLSVTLSREDDSIIDYK